MMQVIKIILNLKKMQLKFTSSIYLFDIIKFDWLLWCQIMQSKQKHNKWHHMPVHQGPTETYKNITLLQSAKEKPKSFHLHVQKQENSIKV